MTAEQRKRLSRTAAGPLALLLCGGLYFGACALAEHRFSAADAASDPEVQQREDLCRYNALSAREQQIYTVLADAMAERQTQTEHVSFVPTQEEFTAAFDALLCDEPLYCDLVRADCAVIATEHTAYAALSYLQDGEQMRLALTECVDHVLCDVSLTDPAAAALQIHDALTELCAYSVQDDGTGAIGSTAYDALVDGYADGMGYALAYALVCREADIPCAVVKGDVTGTDTVGAHAWNVLVLDGICGYTDVMWNDAAISDDGEDIASIPFHGYYFLSADEMAADHTTDDRIGLSGAHDTQNYYEMRGLCASSVEDVAPLLESLLISARRDLSDTVEFWVDKQLGMTDYALKEALGAAINAANAEDDTDAPYLRTDCRIYHTSLYGGGVTVRLFYEENDESLGET